MKRTYDLNVLATTPLITPRELKKALPMTIAANATVLDGRNTIKRILRKEDPRLLVIVGPCSIHDQAAATAPRNGSPGIAARRRAGRAGGIESE
jgi:3-deoxy-7-phosphoheptulonate synthase